MCNYYLLGVLYEAEVASAFSENDIAYESLSDIMSMGELPFELELCKLGYDRRSGVKSSRDLSELKRIWLDFSQTIWREA
jgi:hypothetical protein